MALENRITRLEKQLALHRPALHFVLVGAEETVAEARERVFGPSRAPSDGGGIYTLNLYVRPDAHEG